MWNSFIKQTRVHNPLLFKQKLFSNTSINRAEIELFIDGKSVMIEQGSAIIQACEKAGVDIPRFCYHKRLSVAGKLFLIQLFRRLSLKIGNCRMCLVEIEKAAKPVASCAMPVMPGMKIKTGSPLVKKAREGVMEFLLSNHPLDCPVCDQGGECDLQDQSVRYGSDKSRFGEVTKRAVEDKNFGPLIKTSMNRCIHCTRCVRFANEVAGALEMGTTGRGNEMQIGTYIQHAVNTEMSGNIVDLCPVGALTSKPYAFTSRPWELKNTESIDVLDAVGSNIRVCSRGLEIMRILPRVNEDVNEEWINDKTRYAYDGLKRQRLTTPMVRKGSGFVPCSWSEAFEEISNVLSKTKPENMTAVAGQLADVESLVSLKDLFNKMGSENLRLDTHTHQPPNGIADISSNFLFNSTINSVEDADWILLIGTNPRHEAAIINTRIRKAFLHYQVDIGILGHTSDLNYEFTHLGNSVTDIKNLKGDNAFYKKLATAKNPMVIIGSSIYERQDAGAVMADISKFVHKYKQKFVRDDWTGFNIMQRFASHAGAYEVGFVSNTPSPKKTDFLYLLNADDIKVDDIDADAFVVYQGHHGDIGAAYANIILPGSAYTEKTATYINTEGRTQTTRAAVSPPGAAREDWKIIRALSEVVGHVLPYDNISDLRHRMQDVSPSLVHYDGVLPHLFVEESVEFYAGLKGKVDKSVELTNPIKDFYMTDCISRASKTMAKCSQSFTYDAGYGADKRIAV